MPSGILDAHAMGVLESFGRSFRAGRYGSRSDYVPLSARVFIRSGWRGVWGWRSWRSFSKAGLRHGLRAAFSGSRTTIPADFDLIYHKSELRLFHFKKKMTVKIFLEDEIGSGRNVRGEACRECLENEINGRERAAAAGVRTPRILDWSAEPLPYLVEVYEPGKTLDPEVLREKALPEAVRRTLVLLARRHPPRMLPAGSLPRVAEACRVLGALRSFMVDNHPALADFVRERAGLLEGDQPVWAGYVHGDFVPANVLAPPSGPLCVLDWEASGLSTFGYDVLAFVAKTHARAWQRQARQELTQLLAAARDHVPGASGLAQNAIGDATPDMVREAVVRAFLLYIASQGSDTGKIEVRAHLAQCERGLEGN